MTGGRHVIAVGLIAVSTMFPAAPLSTTVVAQPVTATTDRVPTFAAEMSTVLRINSDNTSEELTTDRVTILAEPALKEWGVQQISFSETIESLQILEAFTQKTDGRKIAVESTAMLTKMETSRPGLPNSSKDTISASEKLFFLLWR